MPSGKKRLVPLRVQHITACVVASMLLIAALIAAFDHCTPPVGSVAFALTALLVTLVLQIAAARGVSRGTLRMAGAIATALAAVATSVLPPLRAGLLGLTNAVTTRINETFNAYIPLAPLPSDMAASWLFYVLAGMAAAWIMWLLISRRRIVVLTLTAFLVGGACLWLQTGPQLHTIVLGLASWFVSWRLMLDNSTIPLRSLISAAIVAAICVAIAAGVAALYQPSPVIDNVRNTTVEVAEAARYGSDSLPEGNLAEASSMTNGTEERLTVTCINTPTGSLHLRGFVGAQLVGTTWQPLDHTAYEGTWTGMFPWLAEQGFTPATQHVAFDDENAAQGATSPALDRMSVQVTGANRKYVYVPYTLRSLNGAATIPNRDGSLLARGLMGPSTYTSEADQVDMGIDSVETPDWLLQGSSGAVTDSYVTNEAVYRSFVYEHYLDISDADRALVERLFYDDTTWNNSETPSVSSVVSRVRAMLTTLASYTDNPTSLPANESFLPWFLEQERAGNSAYFATAAVMALRAQNIPARYTEGYLAEEGSFGQPDETGASSTTLTTKQAHAWVEIYLDGMGWLPAEVAPGFYDQPYRVDDVIDVNQNIAGGNSDGSQAAGALGGDVSKDIGEPEKESQPLNLGGCALTALAALVVALLAAVAALEGSRAWRRSRNAKRTASDDQRIAVPALFDELESTIKAAGVPFNAQHPFDASARFAVAFPGVTSAEYERIVTLSQKYTFGHKELKVHEMRALRRFNERLIAELQPPANMREAFARRYRFTR